MPDSSRYIEVDVPRSRRMGNGKVNALW